MLRYHHRVFQAVQLIRDASLAGFAFWCAYWIRFYAGMLPDVAPPDATESIMVGLGVLVFWPLIGWMQGLYTSRRVASGAQDAWLVGKVTLFTVMSLIICTYMFREVRYSRATILLWTVFAFGFVSAARLASKLALQNLRAKGVNLRHVLVIGTGGLSAYVQRNLERRAELGLRLVGLIKSKDDSVVDPAVDENHILGSIDRLPEILQDLRERGQVIDQVIVALPIEELGRLEGLMATLSRETVDVRLIPDVHQYITLCGSIEDFCGLTMINLQASPMEGWATMIKRAFDLVAGTLALLVGAPVIALIALLVRLSSEGPVLFKQVRVGMDGEPFTMYKFRTMKVNAEAQGPGWTTENDPRRTAIGTFLRKVSFDELPQIFNVLRGEMSLVGPRPEQPKFIDEFREHIPRYALRHKIKAGMTGWAQVNGMRGDTSIQKRIEMDLHYIENWSVGLDVRIILRTVFGGFLSKNAY